MRAFLLGLAIAGVLLLANAAFVGSFGSALALPPYLLQIVCLAGINVILAVSLNLINGFTGQFSIGHAGFMAIGAYAASYFTVTFGGRLREAVGFLPEFGRESLVLLVGLSIGALLAAVAGFLVGVPSLRLRGDYLAIVTLGFGEIFRVVLQQTKDVIFTADEVARTSAPALATHLGGALGFTGIPFYTTLFWAYLAAGILLIVSFRLKRSSYGRALLSIREDETAAEAMGIPTTRYKVQAFVLAAFFAGIAGALFAHLVGTTLNPRELGFQKSFDIVIMVVLGGMGSISGSALAAAILTILPEVLRAVAEYRMIVYALALILMMIVRPQGLFGVHEIWDFFRRKPRAAGP